jgi:predicted ester cyclase
MSTPGWVTTFYQRIWNDGDVDGASEILTADFLFRGSLGAELQGPDAFKDYVRDVRAALANYRCDVLACITEGNQAFARMRFSGRHVGMFLGHRPTGKSVRWEGAALFDFDGQRITRLWVLGDLAGLETMLDRNERA